MDSSPTSPFPSLPHLQDDGQKQITKCIGLLLSKCLVLGCQQTFYFSNVQFQVGNKPFPFQMFGFDNKSSPFQMFGFDNKCFPSMCLILTTSLLLSKCLALTTSIFLFNRFRNSLLSIILYMFMYLVQLQCTTFLAVMQERKETVYNYFICFYSMTLTASVPLLLVITVNRKVHMSVPLLYS